MRNIKILVGILIVLGLFSCKLAKDNTADSSEQIHPLPPDKPVVSQEVMGEVISINSSRNVYEILIKDNSEKLYKILSEKVNISNYNEEIIVGEIYEFSIAQLSHMNVGKQSRKLVVNGKEIIVAPNHYIQDCIMFHGQKFCSDAWEVYEGLNLTNLSINNSR